jgi:chromosome segregation ATPase
MNNATGNGAAPPTSHLMLEGHEDRLQRVEHELSACGRAIEVAAVRIDSLSKQMVEGNAALLERLASGFDSVHDRLGRSESEARNIAASMSIQRRELAELKVKFSSRARLLRRIKSGAIASTVAVGGWALGHFGDVAWQWISR